MGEKKGKKKKEEEGLSALMSLTYNFLSLLWSSSSFDHKEQLK